MWVARGFQQLDEVHNPFIQGPFLCRTCLTNAEQCMSEQMYVSGQVSHLPPPIQLPGNLRVDMQESDLNELAWILPTPACSCATSSARPMICWQLGVTCPEVVNTARALKNCLKNSWGWRERYHSGSVDIELSDLEHAAEGIPYHTATSFL